MQNLVEQIKSYLEISWQILRYPKDFFARIEKEKELKPALRFLAFLWILNSVVLFVIGLVLALVSGTADIGVIVVNQIVALAVNTVLGILFSVVFGLIIHVWIKIFRGRGSWKKSLQLVIYSMTPTMLLGWLQLTAFLATFYFMYLLYLGAQKLHEIPPRKSLAMFVIIPVVLIIIANLLSLGVI